jgi:hypothetical protein
MRPASVWAYLPAGPLERQLKEGSRRDEGKGFRRTLRRELLPYVGGISWGSLC